MSEQVENSCDAMIAKLRDNLNATIDTINGEVTDGYTLEHVPDGHVDLGTRPELVYPWIMVLPDPSKAESDQGARIEWTHDILVVTWIADPDPAGLARRLLRYERAVRDTLLAGRSLSGSYGIGHRFDRRGQVFQPEGEGGYVQYAATMFWVKQQQDIA